MGLGKLTSLNIINEMPRQSTKWDKSNENAADYCHYRGASDHLLKRRCQIFEKARFNKRVYVLDGHICLGTFTLILLHFSASRSNSTTCWHWGIGPFLYVSRLHAANRTTLKPENKTGDKKSVLLSHAPGMSLTISYFSSAIMPKKAYSSEIIPSRKHPMSHYETSRPEEIHKTNRDTFRRLEIEGGGRISTLFQKPNPKKNEAAVMKQLISPNLAGGNQKTPDFSMYHATGNIHSQTEWPTPFKEWFFSSTERSVRSHPFLTLTWFGFGSPGRTASRACALTRSWKNLSATQKVKSCRQFFSSVHHTMLCAGERPGSTRRRALIYQGFSLHMSGA